MVFVQSGHSKIDELNYTVTRVDRFIMFLKHSHCLGSHNKLLDVKYGLEDLEIDQDNQFSWEY